MSTGQTTSDRLGSWPASAKGAVLALAVLVLTALVVITLMVRHDDAAGSSPAMGQATTDAADPTAAGDLLAAQNGAERAARRAVSQMTTYDYRTLAQDFDWVDDAGTEAFQTYFTSSRADVVPVIRKLKVLATGQVVQAAAKAKDVDHARVLLFVDQTIRVAGEKGAKVDQPRVSMEMLRQDGTWLVDSVNVNNLLGSGAR